MLNIVTVNWIPIAFVGSYSPTYNLDNKDTQVRMGNHKVMFTTRALFVAFNRLPAYTVHHYKFIIQLLFSSLDKKSG